MDYSDLCLVDEFDFLDDINCVLDADLLAYSSEELLLGSSTTEACKLSKSDFFSPKTCQPVVQQLLTTAQADGTSTSQHASFQALLDGERFQNVQGASAVGPSAPQSDWPSGEVPTSGPSSNNLETTSKQSFQQVIDKPQTAVRPAPSRSTECSRKAQRHYREKQKVLHIQAGTYVAVLLTAAAAGVWINEIQCFAGAYAAAPRRVGCKQSNHSKATSRESPFTHSVPGPCVCSISEQPDKASDQMHSLAGKTLCQC